MDTDDAGRAIVYAGIGDALATDQAERFAAMSERWHVEKGVPVAVIALLAIQFIGFVYFFAQVESRLTTVEARADAFQSQVSTLPERLVRLETILERIDRKMQ